MIEAKEELHNIYSEAIKLKSRFSEEALIFNAELVSQNNNLKDENNRLSEENDLLDDDIQEKEANVFQLTNQVTGLEKDVARMMATMDAMKRI